MKGMVIRMEHDKTREPQQKRSIEKKNRIIEAGFQLMCEKGYLKTTTPDIAKAAGVSTGIIYSYFKDKHEIFLLGLERCVEIMFFPMLNRLTTSDPDDMEQSINTLLDSLVHLHQTFFKAHNEIESLTYTDPDVATYMQKLEEDATLNVVQYLIQLGYPEKGLYEKVHVCFNLCESFCHEITFHKHESIDYQTMREILVDTILHILS